MFFFLVRDFASPLAGKEGQGRRGGSGAEGDKRDKTGVGDLEAGGAV